MTNRLARLIVVGLVLPGIACEQSASEPIGTVRLAWLRAQAAIGNAQSQYDLGVMYREGRGVPQDDAEAVAWYRKAANQGYAYAQSMLGWMYANGRGVPQDEVLAYMWFNLAAARSSEDHQEYSAYWRDRISARLTPQRRADAQRMAREWQAAFEKRKQ